MLRWFPDKWELVTSMYLILLTDHYLYCQVVRLVYLPLILAGSYLVWDWNFCEETIQQTLRNVGVSAYRSAFSWTDMFKAIRWLFSFHWWSQTPGCLCVYYTRHERAPRELRFFLNISSVYISLFESKTKATTSGAILVFFYY